MSATTAERIGVDAVPGAPRRAMVAESFACARPNSIGPVKAFLEAQGYAVKGEVDGRDLVEERPCTRNQSAPGALVDEELQGSATDTADRVLPAMIACAYAVHARMSSGSSSG